MKVRKLPVTVDAWPVEKVLDWLDARISDRAVGELPPLDLVEAFGVQVDIIDAYGTRHLVVNTLEGRMTRTDGYLIRGVHGEFYPIAADVFAETYEVLS